MIAMNTREAARNVARKVNAAATGAKLKAPVKEDGGWIFPGLAPRIPTSAASECGLRFSPPPQRHFEPEKITLTFRYSAL